MAGNPSHAHEWYPPDCCAGGECIHAPRGTVVRTPGGYLVKKGITNDWKKTLSKDILIPYGDPRVNFMPATEDREPGFHPCFTADNVHCLYVVEELGS